MKILPKHTSLRGFIYICFGIGIFSVLFFPYMVVFSFRAQLLFLIGACLLLVTPWANRRVSLETVSLPPQLPDQPPQKRKPFLYCLGITTLLQVVLTSAFYTICHLTATTLPVGMHPFPLFEASMSILWWSWGIFPWGIYVLVAVGLAYTAYLKKQAGDMSTLIRPLCKNEKGDLISLFADVSMKVAILFSLSSTLACIALECMGVIGTTLHLPLFYGTRLDTFLAMVLILQLTKSDLFSHQISRLLKHRSFFWSVSIFLACATLGMFLISVFIGWFSPAYTPPLNHEISFFPANWHVIWLFFSGVWWLTWTPLISGMMAYLWRGYKIHTMILWILFLPVGMAVWGSLALDGMHTYANLWGLLPLEGMQGRLHAYSSLWNLIPAGFAACCIILFFLRTPALTYVWKACLPRAALHTYQRSPKSFLRMLFTMIVVLIALFWVGGAYIVTILSSGIVFLGTLFICSMGVGVWFILFKKT
jgi:choline-glycine betaine transporter